MPTRLHLQDEACRDLIVRYAQIMDGDDPSGVADLFLEDGRLVFSDQVISGREKIRKHFEGAETRRVCRHVCTNMSVSVRDQEATATTYLMLFKSDIIGEPPKANYSADLPRIGGYIDTIAWTQDGWKFRERRVSMLFV